MPGGQDRLQAGHHQPARQHGLQHQQGGAEDLHRSLQHELRNTPGCKVSAHLLVPGWTTTGKREHKQGAWLPEQVADFLGAALERRDFCIICPDDEVTPEMDRKRIFWAAGDLTDNRPALARWHSDFTDAFARFEP